jgi:hypothetical protein
MANFVPSDGPSIKTGGIQAYKKPLYYMRQTEAFTVTLPSGAIVQGAAGDYVGYDPSTGNVFMMAAAYFAANFTVLSA